MTMKEAECRNSDPDAFFPNIGTRASQHYDMARIICARCEVNGNCLFVALDDGEEFGMWGGATPREREEMKNKPELIAQHFQRLAKIKKKEEAIDELANQFDQADTY
jgi:hypothetical protein